MSARSPHAVAFGSRPGLLRLALAMLGFLGLARPLPASPPDIQRIRDRGALVVAMPSFDSPPFFYQARDGIQGVDVDMAQDLAKALHVGLRFDRQAASFNDTLDRVLKGQADVAICKLSRTLERASSVRFSEPYLVLNHALAINRLRFAALARGQDLATAIRHFTGTIGVIDHSAYAEFAPRNFPSTEVVKFKDWDAVVAALTRGDIVAAYRDEFEVERLMKIDPRLTLTVRTVTLTDLQDSLGMAVAPDHPQLLALINLYLAQRTHKLTLDEVLDRLGEGRP
jgi:ABC-type amino acid transport substrate-binding protein